MGRIILSQADEWHLKNRRQDIRGRTVYDDAEQPVGRVDKLVADTDSGLVDTVILDDGDEIPVNEIRIDDDGVFLTGRHSATAAGTTAAAGGTVGTTTGRSDAERVPDFEEYDEAFRRHYRESYEATGHEYSAYEPAYRYGFRRGIRDEYRDKPYEEIESDIRRGYEERHGEGTWTDMRGAVQRGYTRGREERWSKSGAGGTASGNPGSVMRGDDGSTPFDAHRDTYHRHYSDELKEAEGDFTTYEPAYRHGHRFGTDERYRGREYVEVEPELRSSYEERHGEGTFAGVRGAVRHAFNYAQGGSERPGPTSRRR